MCLFEELEGGQDGKEASLQQQICDHSGTLRLDNGSDEAAAKNAADCHVVDPHRRVTSARYFQGCDVSHVMWGANCAAVECDVWINPGANFNVLFWRYCPCCTL